jgi:hypothetical protein
MSNTDSETEMQAVSDLLLAALRSSTLRAQLDANELKTVSIALRGGMITPEYAIEWLHDLGLVDMSWSAHD